MINCVYAAITTVVTISEILKNNGLATEKSKYNVVSSLTLSLPYFILFFAENFICVKQTNRSSDINSGNEGREQRESSSEGQGQSFISLLK